MVKNLLLGNLRLMYAFGNELFCLENNFSLMDIMIKRNLINPNASIGKEYKVTVRYILANTKYQVRELAEIKRKLDLLESQRYYDLNVISYKLSNQIVVMHSFVNTINVLIKEGLIPNSISLKDVEFNLAQLVELAHNAGQTANDYIDAIEKLAEQWVGL